MIAPAVGFVQLARQKLTPAQEFAAVVRRCGLVELDFGAETDAFGYLTREYMPMDGPVARLIVRTGDRSVRVWMSEGQLEKMNDALLTYHATIK